MVLEILVSGTGYNVSSYRAVIKPDVLFHVLQGNHPKSSVGRGDQDLILHYTRVRHIDYSNTLDGVCKHRPGCL